MDSARSHLARTVVVVLVAGAVFAALRAPFLSLPLERDEGEYAYIAQRIAVGEVPYRDAFDQKPPGVFLAYRVAFALFGESIESIHGFAYLWTAATALALFALVARLASPLAAAFAMLVFAVVSIDPRIGATAANTEIFMLGPLVASVYCLVRALESDRAAWWLGCGFLTVCAVWFKQVAAVQVPFVAVAAALSARRASSSTVLRRLAWAGGCWTVGAAVAITPVLVYFASVGAWQPFLDSVLLHNLEYAQSISLTDGLTVLGYRLGTQWPSFAIFWILGMAALMRPRWAGIRCWALLAGFALSSLAGVCVGLYFRPHYFVQAMPALAGLCGVSLAALASSASSRSASLGWVGIATLIAIVVAPPMWANQGVLWADSAVQRSRRIYGANPFPESLKIGNYIRRTSRPDDRVLVVGSEPQILFYAQRRSATRYIFFYPLTGDYPDALDRQRSVFAEATAADPLYVVWVNVGTSLLIAENSERYIFKEMSRWLKEQYAFEFIARPSSDDADFDFTYGGRGFRILDHLDEDMSRNAWIAVFRRAR